VCCAHALIVRIYNAYDWLRSCVFVYMFPTLNVMGHGSHIRWVSGSWVNSNDPLPALERSSENTKSIKTLGGWGSATDPTGGAYSNLAGPLAGLRASQLRASKLLLNQGPSEPCYTTGQHDTVILSWQVSECRLMTLTYFDFVTEIVITLRRMK